MPKLPQTLHPSEAVPLVRGPKYKVGQLIILTNPDAATLRAGWHHLQIGRILRAHNAKSYIYSIQWHHGWSQVFEEEIEEVSTSVIEHSS